MRPALLLFPLSDNRFDVCIQENLCRKRNYITDENHLYLSRGSQIPGLGLELFKILFSAEDAQDLQVKTLSVEIVSLREELSNLQAKEEIFTQEKVQLESVLNLALFKVRDPCPAYNCKQTAVSFHTMPFFKM